MLKVKIKSISLSIIVIIVLSYANLVDENQKYIDYLDSDNVDSVKYSLEYFTYLYDNKYLPAIIEHYWNINNPILKKEFVWLIGHLGGMKIKEKTYYGVYYEKTDIDTSIYPVLDDALLDTNNIVLIEVISIIGSIGADEYLDKLIKYLYHKDENPVSFGAIPI